MAELGVLVEVAMSQKHFDVVETLLRSVPKEVARAASFRERYKAFLLFKWVEKDAWRTDEPRLILATLQDNLLVAETDGIIQQAAAQILKTKIKPAMSMQAFKKVIDQTFPEENFDDEKKKLLDISAEFESPLNVIKALAEKKESEFRRSVLEIAQGMESQLPRLKVEVAPAAHPEKELEEEDDEEDEEITFSAADLRRAFGGSWDEWDQIVKQEDPEVKAFLARRNGTPLDKPSGSSSAKKSSVVVQKRPMAAAPPPPGPYAAAPKRKLSEGLANNKTSAPAPGKKQNSASKASPASGGGGGDGKRQRRFWSREEELDLVKGVRKYGKGSWRKIMQDESLTFYERSATDLKDKWRNLEKKKEEYEKELDAMEDVDDDDEEGGAFGSRKQTAKKSSGSKREVEDEVIDDSGDHVVVPVKKEPATKKQTLSPSQIRESALEARNRRLRQLNNE